jgi:hypothetical protein
MLFKRSAHEAHVIANELPDPKMGKDSAFR